MTNTAPPRQPASGKINHLSTPRGWIAKGALNHDDPPTSGSTPKDFKCTVVLARTDFLVRVRQASPIPCGEPSVWSIQLSA